MAVEHPGPIRLANLNPHRVQLASRLWVMLTMLSEGKALRKKPAVAEQAVAEEAVPEQAVPQEAVAEQALLRISSCAR